MRTSNEPFLPGSWDGEEFLDLAEASAGVGVWDMDLATGLVRGRPQFFRVMGLEPRVDPVPVDVFRALRHPEDRAKVVDGFRKALNNQADYYESEYRIQRPDGQLRWILGRGKVVRDPQGNPVRYFGVDIDITDRKRADEALRAAETRFLQVFQLAPVAMSLSTLGDGRYLDVNTALLDQTSYTRAEVIGRTARDLRVYVDEADFARVREILSKDGAVENLEIRLRGKHDVRTVLFSADRVEFGAEPCLITCSVDISDRKDAEARQALLVRELQHRGRNLLGVIQTIASSTLKTSRDLVTANETLNGRLQALARAQHFIAAGRTGGAPIDEIVRAELEPFGGRVTMGGPRVVAGNSFAQMFAVLVHELATNATKHGSLTKAEGRVEIEWTADDRSGFSFVWRERGGPPVRPPTTRGFGSQLISAALGEKPHIRYGESGFEYEILVPIKHFRGN